MSPCEKSVAFSLTGHQRLQDFLNEPLRSQNIAGDCKIQLYFVSARFYSKRREKFGHL